MRQWVAVFLLTCLLLFGAFGLAFAHASLVRADPAPGSVLAQPPGQVQLWFDENVEPHFSKVEVQDTAHARVDTRALGLAPGDPKSLIIPLKPLANGTYAVVWQVLSATDGHVTRGVFGFSVGQVTGSVSTGGETGAEQVSAASSLTRGINLLFLLALVGALAFRLLVLDRSLASVDERVRGAAGRRWTILVGVLFVLTASAGLTELVVQANTVASEVSLASIVSVLTGTRFGTLWAVRLALLLGAALALAYRASDRRLVAVSLALTVLGLLTRSLTSHGAAEQGDLSLAVLSDWLHIVGVSVWVGGLISMALLLPVIWIRLALEIRGRWILNLVSRFSLVALFATPIIALTGFYNSTLQVPSFDALYTTFYGDTLLLKVALFGVMLLLGAVNLLLLTPRLRHALNAADRNAHLVSRFRMSLAFEVVLGIAAIGLAGFLTAQPPARAEIAARTPLTQPVSRVLLVGDAAPDVRVQLVAGPAGSPAQFDAHVIDSKDKPVGAVLRVIFNLTRLDSDTGAQTINAEPAADGHYLASGSLLPIDGLWRIRVIVRRKALEDVAVDFPYYVAPASSSLPATDPRARDLLATSEAEMNRLSSVRSDQYLNDGANGEVVTHFEYRAPDRMRFTIPGQGESIAIGTTQYYQDKSGEWIKQARVSPLVFPQFNILAQARGITLGRQESNVDGVPARIVRFETEEGGGSSALHYAYWISTQNSRLIQFAMVTADHYMIQTYKDFDAPDIVIEPPPLSPSASGPVAGATTTPVAAPAPLTTARRLPGLITGDLQGDGALILLVAGIVFYATGLVRRASRQSRLGLLAVGTACTVAGLGLFIDALNSTGIQAGTVSVDSNLAAAGRGYYQQYCLTCHGPQGRGDGPGGASLPVKPFDLTTHVLQHDETYLYAVILNGRGYMPQFGDRLTQDQIIRVIAYIRQLAIDGQRQNAAPGFTPAP